MSRNVSREPQTVGYIETKDLDADLGAVEQSDQLKRYLSSLENLILTNYLEFRWYVDGDLRLSARLGTFDRVKRQIVRDRSNEDNSLGLISEFLGHSPPQITRARDLAQRLAQTTHMIRNIIASALDQGQASDSLRGLRKAFSDVLVPNISNDAFADMFAQTLAYGLFAARVNHDPTQGRFQRLGAASEIPRTNPFLRNLFAQITGPTLDDEPFVDFVDDVVQLLAECDMGSILMEFGKSAAREDPVVHFYETFLAAYDPELREKRGVYYTPEPVVSYIVRSVDHLLRERFDLPDGLADQSTTSYTIETYTDRSKNSSGSAREKRESPRVLILDPATGTGTFLYAVIELIRERFMRRRNAGLWSSYVREQLLPRLFGFELLMAPYAVAHLKLGMQLAGQSLSEEARKNWSYEFNSMERLNVFLTNTLEEGLKHTEMTLGQFISQEANAAASIKRDLPIMVVLGNPPYSGHSANRSRNEAGGITWIGELIEDYKRVDGEPLKERNSKWLQDDYVKFIRFGQWRIRRSGSGILAFITSHGYLENPTFRGMRQQLVQTFSSIYILDLHGSVKKRQVAPGDTPDENVFDIQQGVSIGIFVRARGRNGPARVYHADLWGDRGNKYRWLSEQSLATTRWERIVPSSPSYLFIPINSVLQSEFNQGWRITEIMQTHSVGITTSRDKFAYGFDRMQLERRITDFLDPQKSDDTVRAQYFDTRSSGNRKAGDTGDWRMSERRRALQKDSEWRKRIVRCLYRPFDSRFLFYHRDAVERGRWKVMEHMLHETNLAIATTRSVEIGRGFEHVLCTSIPMQLHAVSLKEGNYIFPLYLYPPREGEPNSQSEMRDISPWPEGRSGRRPNLDPRFVSELAQLLDWTFLPDGRGNLGEMSRSTKGHRKPEEATFGPEDIFNYIYAILHAPSYRSRYAQLLKLDYPHVPLTSDTKLFSALARLGARLVGFHTMDAESAELQDPITSYPIRGTSEVAPGYPRYFAPGELDPLTGKPLSEGRVYINRGNVRKGESGQYFDGVPPEVWEFHIGGYQVCDKWLKDRQKRELSFTDLTHYQRIIVALQETIRLMDAIDDAIPGWPLP